LTLASIVAEQDVSRVTQPQISHATQSEKYGEERRLMANARTDTRESREDLPSDQTDGEG